MALARDSGFLPTIKCSSCAQQVEISMMGDHICGGPSAELSPPPESSSTFDDSYALAPPLKYGKMLPPVDTTVANQSYLQQGQITPVSHPSGSRNISPVSPFARSQNAGQNEYFSRSGMSDGSSTPRRPGGYGGFGDSPVEQDDPSKPFGSSLVERAELISPGPFDPNRRPSAAQLSVPSRNDSVDKMDGAHEDRPGTANSNMSASSGAYTTTPSAPRKNGYGGFGAPPTLIDDAKPGPLGSISRSETFPKPSLPLEPPPRTGSAPGVRPDRRQSSRSIGGGRRPSAGPDTSRPPPPRRSLLRPRAYGKEGSVDLAVEFGVGNPYHTPSDSGSSGYSGFSGPSRSSSQTSPARSQVNRKPSDANRINELMDDLQSSMGDLRTHDTNPSTDAPPPPRTRTPLAEQVYGTSPREISTIPEAHQIEPPPRSLDRPMPPQPDFGILAPSSPDRRQQSPAGYGTSPPSQRMAPPLRKNSRDPGARGDCKACGLAITGKSISSADGRLTGKYHKACFVCATCSEPFTSAEFYVLDNKPYCEQHYHHLNGSLCGSCGRGIEGQFVQDETAMKYHVGCFCCLDCGRSLSDGYFEVDGQPYCEADAWRRVQPPPAAEQDPYMQLQPPPRGYPGSRPPPPHGRMGPPGPGRMGPPRPGPGAYGGPGMPRPPYGAPRPPLNGGGRMPPGAGLRPPPPPQMNKRMTRLGMM